MQLEATRRIAKNKVLTMPASHRPVIQQPRKQS
jgi:hypothetical protein